MPNIFLTVLAAEPPPIDDNDGSFFGFIPSRVSM